MQQQWSDHELVEHWPLNDEEQALLFDLTGENQLGLAVYLKFFQNEGRFPYNHAEITQMAIDYLAASLQLSSSLFSHYIPLSRRGKSQRSDQP